MLVRGGLRVQMPLGFGRKVVLPALTREIAAHPELTIDVELGDRGVDVIEEGFDAVIRFGSLPDSGLVARKLCDVVPCASPEYLKRKGIPQTPDDLAHHTCLGYATLWHGRYRPWVFQDRENSNLAHHEIAGQVNVNSAESLMEVASAGGGIAMIGDFVAYEAVRAGRLRVLLHDYIAPPHQVSVLYSPTRQRSPRLRWFLDLLQDAVPNPAPWSHILSLEP